MIKTSPSTAEPPRRRETIKTSPRTAGDPHRRWSGGWLEVEDIDPDTGELLGTHLQRLDADGQPTGEPINPTPHRCRPLAGCWAEVDATADQTAADPPHRGRGAAGQPARRQRCAR